MKYVLLYGTGVVPAVEKVVCMIARFSETSDQDVLVKVEFNSEEEMKQFIEDRGLVDTVSLDIEGELEDEDVG